jgi:GAF domain-containing protein
VTEFNQITYQSNRENFYLELRSELRAMYCEYWLTNLANFSAMLMAQLPEINWVGFYLNTPTGELQLGPFQGLPACLNIPLGKGVCGTAARDRKTMLVADVHQFPGHIACDARSRSEIVVPMVLEKQLLGVLDIDSPKIERFDQVDQNALEQMVKDLIQSSQWPPWFI